MSFAEPGQQTKTLLPRAITRPLVAAGTGAIAMSVVVPDLRYTFPPELPVIGGMNLGAMGIGAAMGFSTDWIIDGVHIFNGIPSPLRLFMLPSLVTHVIASYLSFAVIPIVLGSGNIMDLIEPQSNAFRVGMAGVASGLAAQLFVDKFVEDILHI